MIGQRRDSLLKDHQLSNKRRKPRNVVEKKCGKNLVSPLINMIISFLKANIFQTKQIQEYFGQLNKKGNTIPALNELINSSFRPVIAYFFHHRFKREIMVIKKKLSYNDAKNTNTTRNMLQYHDFIVQRFVKGKFYNFALYQKKIQKKLLCNKKNISVQQMQQDKKNVKIRKGRKCKQSILIFDHEEYFPQENINSIQNLDDIQNWNFSQELISKFSQKKQNEIQSQIFGDEYNLIAQKQQQFYLKRNDGYFEKTLDFLEDINSKNEIFAALKNRSLQ